MSIGRPGMGAWLKAALVVLALQGAQAASASADLPRREGSASEQLPGVATTYGNVTLEDGARLRTLVTRPEATDGELPALLFVQWLSCDTVELDQGDTSGWAEMMRGLIQTPGLIVMRTEKAGVGDSEGPECSSLDYETELEGHKASYRQLLTTPGVDPQRVFIFGASMGSTMAPLVAEAGSPAGIIAWGGGTKPWLERQLAFERRAMELGGASAREVDARMVKVRDFYRLYLMEGLTPPEITSRRADLASVPSELVGVSESDHFGRPFSFHQQAQAQDWAGAWRRVQAPVLVLYGEYDWFEDRQGHELIADSVNTSVDGAAELIVFDGLDHHFMRYQSAEEAFREENGTVAAAEVVAAIRSFISRVTATE